MFKEAEAEIMAFIRLTAWIIWLTCKGTFQKRFSGIRPLRGSPPPTPLTENESEKKKVFFLSGKGGYPPPLNGRIPLKRK